MKYFRIGFSVLLVVLLGYLYSCSLDNPTKPSSSGTQEGLGDSPKGECPDLAGYNMSHYCLYFWHDGEDVTWSAYDAEVWVTGRNDNDSIVYTCHYLQPGHSNGTGFGSRLPVGLHITRTACVYMADGRPWGGVQTFLTTLDDDNINFMYLDLKCR